MPADEVVATLRQAWDILAEMHVPAALMGGMALAHWGHIRSTQDVDLLIALSGARPQTLLSRLAAGGVTVEGPRTCNSSGRRLIYSTHIYAAWRRSEDSD